MLEAGHCTDHRVLHIIRHRRTHSGKIHLVGIISFRLHKNLMPFLFGKLYDFIFNGRTISRPCPLDLAGKQRRSGNVIPDDPVRFLIRICQPAVDLLLCDILRLVRERKRTDKIVSFLNLHFGKINCSAVDSCRRTGLKSSDRKSETDQGIRQMICSLQAIRSRIFTDFTVNASCVQIDAGTYDHLFAVVYRSCKSPDSAYFSVRSGLFLQIIRQAFCHTLRQYFTDLRLFDHKSGRIFKRFSHFTDIILFIRLGPEAVHCRSFGPVDNFALNIGLIYIFAHFAAERIQLAHQMSLRASADIGIAGHKGNTVHADSKHHSPETQSCSSQGSFTTRMTGTDHGNIKLFFNISFHSSVILTQKNRGHKSFACPLFQ